MLISYPWMLLVLILCAGVFTWWLRDSRSHANLYSDERLLASPPKWMIYFWRIALGGLVCAFLFGVFALARPMGSIVESRLHEEMHRGCLVIDISLSMNIMEDAVTQETRIQVVVKSAKEFAQKRKGDQLCMVPFETGVRLALAMAPTTDTNAFNQALDNLITHVEGNTAMGDGMFFAFSMLLGDILERNERLNISRLQKEIAQVKDGRIDGLAYIDDLVNRNGMLTDTYMLVLTDGEYNTGIVDPLALLSVLKRFGLKTYILGVGKDFAANERLVHLVKQTGGDVLYAYDANNTPQFLEAINRLQKRKILTEVTRKQIELAPMAMGIALGCVLFFLCIWAVLRGGAVFGLFRPRSVPLGANGLGAPGSRVAQGRRTW